MLIAQKHSSYLTNRIDSHPFFTKGCWIYCYIVNSKSTLFPQDMFDSGRGTFCHQISFKFVLTEF